MVDSFLELVSYTMRKECGFCSANRFRIQLHGSKFKTEGGFYALLRLLLVVPAYSPQGPPLPESALNRIDTIFFAHVAVRRPVRPFTPETLLDLLRAVHQLQVQFFAAPSPCIRLGVAKRQAKLQIVMVQARIAFLQMHLIAVDRAVGIHPGSLIVTRRLNHQGVSIPMRSRISVPTRLWIIRELAAVRPKVAPSVVPFEEHHEFVRKLNEPVVRVVQVAGVTRRVALEQRIIPIFLVLIEPKGQRRISGGRPGFTPLLLAP